MFKNLVFKSEKKNTQVNILIFIPSEFNIGSSHNLTVGDFNTWFRFSFLFIIKTKNILKKGFILV